ncbi:hypothetical protein ACH5RR_021580 [Cinchona calisaya]|uniref:Uncharacterized protein n=1 Tax=Cinchona calisaya TaxID=153742 RepID=A0ABD2ZHP2_9GENT
MQNVFERNDMLCGVDSRIWIRTIRDQKNWGYDINVVIRLEEYIGHTTLDLRAILDFSSCIHDCRMLELPYSGNTFTWTAYVDATSLFRDIVEQSRNSSIQGTSMRLLFEKLKILKVTIQASNKHTFGNIYDNILRVDANIE